MDLEGCHGPLRSACRVLLAPRRNWQNRQVGSKLGMLERIMMERDGEVQENVGSNVQLHEYRRIFCVYQ